MSKTEFYQRFEDASAKFNELDKQLQGWAQSEGELTEEEKSSLNAEADTIEAALDSIESKIQQSDV